MRLFLTFGTTHGALKAERILRAAGIGVQVVPKPSAIRGPCGLAIRVGSDQQGAALAALEAAGHPPRQSALVP